MKATHLIAISLTTALLLGAGCAEKTTDVSNASPTADSPTAATPPTTTPTVAATAPGSEATVLLSGNFVAGEHPTQGSVRVVTEGNKRLLELDQTFETSTSGPDLVVILHRSADVIGSTKPPAYSIKEGDYVLLAPLSQYQGAQRYEIPASVNLDDFKSAAIWCRQFNATFGAATLAAS